MTLRLICYDIQDDLLRTKISKKLLHFGCVRIQKSVFCGELADIHWAQCQQKIESMFEKNKKEPDSIYFIPISEGTLQRTKTMGSEMDMASIMVRQLVLWV